MNLMLKVNRAQHGSSDRLSDRWVVLRAHRLAEFLDTDDLDEPDDRIAQIGEKSRTGSGSARRRDDNPKGEM
jgi:hypothetical protein